MNVYCISKIDFKTKTIKAVKKKDIRITTNQQQGHTFPSEVISFFGSFCLKGMLKILYKQKHSSMGIIFFNKFFTGPNKSAYIKKKPVTRLDILNKRNDMG